jgi:GNAT superfamily N-acetyltransferase
MVNVSFCRLGRIVPAPFAGYILPYVRSMLARTEDGADFLVVGAIWNGLACGAAVVEWVEDGGVVRSLFVDPKARGCGVAGHLLDLLCAEGAHLGKQALFIDYILNREELAAMDALVLARGGEYETGAPVCGMLSDDFLTSPLLGPALRADWKRPEAVALFSELSERQLAQLSDVDIPAYLRPAALGERLDPGLSAAWLESGDPVAFTLGFQSGERMFCQSSIWRGPDAPEGSFRALICTQVNQCWYRSGGSFVFFISPINPRSAAMAEWFTGGNYEPYSQREAVIPIPTPET